MDINGGQYPNPNGSPIWPGTQFTGPLLAGNVVHSDGTGALAGLGESSGKANVGFAQMVQTQAGISFALGAVVTDIVIPAQSQITDIYAMVTTAQAAGSVGFGTTVGGPIALTPAAEDSLAAVGLITTAVPVTPAQIALWDNVGNTDIRVTATANALGTGVITMSVMYIQGINNVS
jgi:hypothetical protein